MRKFLLFFAGFVFLAILFISVAPYVFRDKIKARLLQEIDKKVDAEVSFSDVSVSSFQNFPHLTLGLHDFVIMGKEDFVGDTLAYAKVVSVSFDYYNLLRGKDININRIHLTSPLVHLRTLSNGDVNYNIWKGGTDSTSHSNDTSQFKINIKQWEIENGRFVMYDRPQRSYLELRGINHRGNGDFSQDISDLKIATTVEAISYSLNGIKYLDRKKLSTNLIMEMNLKEYKFTFKDHVFQINHFKFGFEGYLKFPKKGYEVDLHLLVNNSDFKNFLSLMPGFYVDDFKKMKVDGDFTMDGHIKGVYDFATNEIPTFALELKVKNGSFKYDDLPKAMENINLELLISNDQGIPDNTTFDLQSFRFDVDHDPVNGRLKVIGMTHPYIDADIKADIDLEELEKMHAMDSARLKGNLFADVKIKGLYDKDRKRFPLVDANLKLNKGSLKFKEYPVPIDSIYIDAEVVNATGNMEDTRIDVHKLIYRVEDEPFVMSGHVDNLIDYHYDVDIDGLIDLEKLSKLYPQKEVSFTGTMDIDVKSTGKASDLEAKKYNLIQSEGTIDVKNLVILDRELAKPLKISEVKMELTPEKILLKSMKGSIGRTTFSTHGELSEYLSSFLGENQLMVGDLVLTCDTLDLNELQPASAAKADTTSSMKIIPIPRGIDFTFDATLNYVKFGQMDIENLNGELAIKDGVLSIKETGFAAKGAKFAFNGQYDTRDMKHPSFDVVMDIDRLDINKAYLMFATPAPNAPTTQYADGLFSTKYHLKGELAPDFTPILNTLSGSGTIIVDSAQIKGMKVMNHVSKITKKDELNNPQVQDIKVETEIKNGQVLIKPFTFQIGKYTTELEGSHSFNNDMNYVLKIGVPPLNKLKIPFHISGTVDKPVVKLGKGHENFDFSGF
jgi:AsmA-like C-terminal region